MFAIPILTTWCSKDAQPGRRARLQPVSMSNRSALGRAPQNWFPFLSDTARLVLSVGALLDSRFDFRHRSNPAHVRHRSGANSGSNVIACWNNRKLRPFKNKYACWTLSEEAPFITFAYACGLLLLQQSQAGPKCQARHQRVSRKFQSRHHPNG